MKKEKKLNLVFLKKKREQEGLTLQQMADVLGLKTASNYLKYETGVYSLNADKLPALAKALKCEISDFFA